MPPDSGEYLQIRLSSNLNARNLFLQYQVFRQLAGTQRFWLNSPRCSARRISDVIAVAALTGEPC